MDDSSSYALSNMTLDYSPISLLPPEILAQIFECCSAEDPFDTPVRLSHVSSAWRKTALSAPRIWDRIVAILPSDRPEVTFHRTTSWLARSGAVPLHITLVVKEEPLEHYELLADVEKHVWHCVRLRLHAWSHKIARQVAVFLGASRSNRMQMLGRLDIIAGPSWLPSLAEELQEVDEDELNALDDVTDIFRVLADANAPRLRELNIETGILPRAFLQPPKVMSLMHLWPTDLSRSTTLALPSLHTLRVYERVSISIEITAISILHLLAKCPSLRTLEFRGNPNFNLQGLEGVAPIHLPHLHTLLICQTFYQRIILSHIVAPSLNHLCLKWLNRPERIVDESYEPDPSEVSEGPVEYSQSPYTDLLSGAGLRSLIRQSMRFSGSYLPITVFDMDYADIRSPKDFLWVFEHLPFLEEFRIIGSDMSDKVLFSLAGERMGAGGVQEGWLCPRLRKVELSRCDVITGKGVLALAKARNPCLSSLDEEQEQCKARPARLDKFIVEGCASVDCESSAVLQYIMGDVTFEVEEVVGRELYPWAEIGVEMPD